MHNAKMQHGPAEGAALVVIAGGQDTTTNQSTQHKQSITDAAILASTSTAIDIQLRKVLLLLLSGPKTTIELRKRGVMMPAARVHTLRHEHGHNITTTLQTMFDAEGISHPRCAKYCLVQAASEVAP